MSGIERRLRRGDRSGFALLNVKFGPVFLAMQAAIAVKDGVHGKSVFLALFRALRQQNRSMMGQKWLICGRQRGGKYCHFAAIVYIYGRKPNMQRYAHNHAGRLMSKNGISTARGSRIAYLLSEMP